MILILGITGSGKGRLAFALAEGCGAEIVSIDSMKVYRRMDIGTAKPSEDARHRVKYHLIDVAEPSESFSVGSFYDLSSQAVEDVRRRKKPVMAVGGTALYAKALLYGLFEGPGTDEKIRESLKARAEAEGPAALHRRLDEIDPAAAARIHPNDVRRIIRALEVYEITGRPISSFQRQWEAGDTKQDWTIIGLRRDKDQESRRINARVKKMIASGLVDEVRSLLAEERPLSKQARCAIGYAEIIDHLNGRISLEDATEQIKKNTRRLAKSQRTWFKAFANVNWLEIGAEEPPEETLERAKRLLRDAR